VSEVPLVWCEPLVRSCRAFRAFGLIKTRFFTIRRRLSYIHARVYSFLRLLATLRSLYVALSARTDGAPDLRLRSP
jgi:hypothetical protein